MNRGVGFFSSGIGGNTPSPIKPFFFGTGGGVMLSAPYNPGEGGIPVADQIAMIASYSGTATRFSVPSSAIDDSGALNSTNLTRLQNYVNAAVAGNIKMVVSVADRMFSAVWAGDTTNAYNMGYALMNGFVTNYGSLFPDKIYELSNEIVLFRQLNNVLDGQGNPTSEKLGPGYLPSHYNARFPKAIQYIAGMESGCKDADSDAKTIFNTSSWGKTYTWEQAFLTAPTIDYCGLHWYHEMQALYNQGQYPGGDDGATTIVDFLYGRYGKKIWTTEANARWVTTNDPPDMTEQQREQRQLDFFQEFYVICRDHIHCIGYSIHELFSAAASDDDYGINYFPGLSGNNYVETLTARLLAQYLVNNGPDGP